MHAITIRTIQTKIHPQIKTLFWFLFVGTRGGRNRIRIISTLRKTPCNKNQLSNILEIDYKGIQHHLRMLEENNLVTKVGDSYGVTYFVSQLFLEGSEVFDEIVTKIEKTKINA